MSAAEDERKQRFRFHKEDEILLLQIVLAANPCPYNISSRDGAIMMAWNSIAEEFKDKCVQRLDGKVPLPRTCRTRCDKMITDFLASRASPNLKKQKQESKEDKTKNDLLEQLARLQGRILHDPVTLSSASDHHVDPDSIATGSGTAGSSAVTSSHLLAQNVASSSSSPLTLNVSDTQGQGLVPSHVHPSQHNTASPVASSGIVPQSTINLGHRTNQPTADLLAASAFLLPNNHHQDAVANITASAIPDRSPRQVGTPMTTRKRRANPATETSTTTSLSYLQSRPGISSSVQIQHTNVSTGAGNSRRPRPLAIKPSSASTPTNLHGQPINSHHSNPSRLAVNSIISGLGSSLSGQGLTELPNVDGTIQEDSDDNEEDEDEEEDDNDDQGYQDAQEDLENIYEDDDVGDIVVNHGEDHSEVASLLTLQNGPTMIGREVRKAMKRTAPGSSGPLTGSLGKYSRTTSSQSLQRHASNSNLNKNPLSPIFTGGGLGTLSSQLPSQMTPEDRSFSLRVMALEEQRVAVEVDRIALEREKLALERSRLKWEMEQVNAQLNSYA